MNNATEISCKVVPLQCNRCQNHLHAGHEMVLLQHANSNEEVLAAFVVQGYQIGNEIVVLNYDENQQIPVIKKSRDHVEIVVNSSANDATDDSAADEPAGETKSRVIFEDNTCEVRISEHPSGCNAARNSSGERKQAAAPAATAAPATPAAPTAPLAAQYHDLLKPADCLCEYCGVQFPNLFLLLQHNVEHVNMAIFGLKQNGSPPPTVTPPVAANTDTEEEKRKRRIAKPNLDAMNKLKESLIKDKRYKACSNCFRYIHSTGLNFKLMSYVGKNRMMQQCDICKKKFTLIVLLKILRSDQKKAKKVNLARLTNMHRRIKIVRRRHAKFF